MTAVVGLKNLGHAYGDKPALRGLSFDVAAGETFGLLGPNGGGKSTLFRILSTYFAPTSGSAMVFGLDVRSQAAEIRRRIGVVFQNPSVDAKLTVDENLRHQGHLYGLRGAELRRRSDEMLQRYGKRQTGDFVSTLSAACGCVELAKGLLHRPELSCWTSRRPALTQAGASGITWDLKAQAASPFVTTHLMEEAERCDRLALDRGAWPRRPAQRLKGQIGGDIISVESPDRPGCARPWPINSARSRLGRDLAAP